MPNAPVLPVDDTAAPEVAAFIQLRYRDDRGEWKKDWNVEIRRSASPTWKIRRVGLYRTRQYEIVMQAALPQVVVGMEEDVVVTR